LRQARSAVTARNVRAFEDAQAVHAGVKAIMAARSPLARPLSAKQVRARLSPHLRRDERTIRLHMQSIHREAEIDCRDGNSSAESDAA
jgi:hypothetical protein